MSFFKKIFKKKDKTIKISKKTETQTNVAVNQMQDTEELLMKRRRLLEKKVSDETDKARALLAKKDKNGAMMAMKRKKQYEAQIQKLDAQINNVSTMNMSVQDASLNADVLNAQISGAESIKRVFKDIGGIDKVDKVMDDVRDAMDTSNDLSNAISQDLGGGAYIDEDDLENELAELEAEGEDAQDLEIKTGHKMLPVPAPGAKKVGNNEEDELAMLEASMT